MSHQLYTVTMTDLATYAVTVAADSPQHAQSVAEALLVEEASDLPAGLTRDKRETEAMAVLADAQPVRQFDVYGTYSMDFFIRVPAANAEDAERHARRIYANDPMPFEYATGEDRLRWSYAREVVS